MSTTPLTSREREHRLTSAYEGLMKDLRDKRKFLEKNLKLDSNRDLRAKVELQRTIHDCKTMEKFLRLKTYDFEDFARHEAHSR